MKPGNQNSCFLGQYEREGALWYVCAGFCRSLGADGFCSSMKERVR